MTPTTKQFDAILSYLDRFSAEGFTAGTWHENSDHTLWFEFSDLVSEFRQALYDNGWTPRSFEWPKWQETAQKYVAEPGRIDSADIETIKKLFTTHIRKDRFCDGHLAVMFENGHIVALLRRLQELRSQIG